MTVGKGTNKGKAALREALRLNTEVYKSFWENPTQIAAFHGIPVEHAIKLVDLVKVGDTDRITSILLSNPSWIYLWELLYGGIRSGKTFAICLRLWLSAMQFAGVKILVARKRKEQLRHTILDEFEKVGRLLTNDKIELLGEQKAEKDGALVYQVFGPNPRHPSEIIFAIEPDQQTDQQIELRWLGYTIFAAVTEETPQLREISVKTIRSRVSLEADANGLSIGDYRWMASISNPVDVGHWLQVFKQQNEVVYRMGKRPSCLVIKSKPKDNAHNLPSNYEEEMRETLKNDPVKLRKWIDGEDGLEVDGKPVYGAQFNRQLHEDKYLAFNPFKPLIRGWDFGYHHPACVFLQEDDKGCINVLAEMLGSDETAENFADRVLSYTMINFPDAASGVSDWGDPAGAQQTDKGDSTIAILRRKGILVKYRPTAIDGGVKHVRALLTRLRGNPARPELCFSPACPILLTAFERGYHYKKYTDGTFSAKPHKDGYYDHLCDALRYALVNIRAIPMAFEEHMLQAGNPLAGNLPMSAPDDVPAGTSETDY